VSRSGTDTDGSPVEGRRYPARPLVGVGAVVLVEGRVVLVRRRFPPLADCWSLPGGLVDAGETLAEALVREVREETGLEIDVGPVVEILDRIHRDANDRVEYHYVIVDYVCRARAGEPRPGSDVSKVAVAAPDALGDYGLADVTIRVIDEALANAPWSVPSPSHAPRGGHGPRS